MQEPKLWRRCAWVVSRGLKFCFFLQFCQFFLQLCTIACGVDFAEMVKVVENIKKKEVPKFDPETARQQDILELKGRVPKLTKEQSIKISLADFTLKTTLGRGGYGKVKIKQLLQDVTGLTGTLFLSTKIKKGPPSQPELLFHEY